ncbi:MAG: preprotein translocase subunit SecE [Patescibacteria group bacterium]
MGEKVISYIKESREEMKRVNWPTRRQTVVSTGVVIGISVGVAAFLGSLDLAFQSLLRLFIL